MYHYKARIYSPTLGRFLQTDPIGYEDQMNLYAYVGNDPVNGTDPSGMATQTECERGSSVCSGESTLGMMVAKAAQAAQKAGEGIKRAGETVKRVPGNVTRLIRGPLNVSGMGVNGQRLVVGWIRPKLKR